MQIGELAKEDNRLQYKEKQNKTRDRYGAKEKKRAALEVERDLRRLEEQAMEKIDNSKLLYNNWFDLTETKFWKKYVRQDVTFYGIHTKYKK